MGIPGCSKHARESVLARNVTTCQRLKEVSGLPWERVAVDLFDFASKVHIVIKDSYFGFTNYNDLASTSSSEVIKTLKRWFVTHGIP